MLQKALQLRLLCDPAAGGWSGPLQLGTQGTALEKEQKGLHAHALPFPSKNSKDPTPTPLHKVDADFNPNAVPSLTFLLCGLSHPVLPNREGMGNSVCPVLESSSHVNDG